MDHSTRRDSARDESTIVCREAIEHHQQWAMLLRCMLRDLQKHDDCIGKDRHYVAMVRIRDLTHHPAKDSNDPILRHSRRCPLRDVTEYEFLETLIRRVSYLGLLLSGRAIHTEYIGRHSAILTSEEIVSEASSRSKIERTLHACVSMTLSLQNGSTHSPQPSSTRQSEISLSRFRLPGTPRYLPEDCQCKISARIRALQTT
jgi:hypothetical protein